MNVPDGHGYPVDRNTDQSSEFTAADIGIWADLAPHRIGIQSDHSSITHRCPIFLPLIRPS
jgi:hypothetical protein